MGKACLPFYLPGFPAQSTLTGMKFYIYSLHKLIPESRSGVGLLRLSAMIRVFACVHHVVFCGALMALSAPCVISRSLFVLTK